MPIPAAIKVSLLIGLIANVVVIISGYYFYAANFGYPAVLDICSGTPDSDIDRVVAAVALFVGIPFSISGALTVSRKLRTIQTLCIVLAFVLNLTPLWLANKIDNYVIAVHSSMLSQNCGPG